MKDPLVQLCEYLATVTELAATCELAEVLKIDPKQIPLELAKVKNGFENFKSPCSAFMAKQWDEVRQFAEHNRAESDLIETARRIRLALAASWAALHSTRLCVQFVQATLGDLAPAQSGESRLQ